MKTWNRIVIAAILITTLFSGVPFGYAATNQEQIDTLNRQIVERKNRIRQLEETMAKYQSTITQKQTEAMSLKNQISLLDARVGKINTDISLTEERIEQAELEIKELTLTINDKQKSITKQQKIISQMVRSIQEGDQKNYLEIMMTYDDFASFYNELKATENVYVDLGASVKALRLAKEDLGSKQKQIEEKKRQQQSLKDQLEDKKSDLSQQISLKGRLLKDTKSSEARYQTLLGSLKSQYNTTEAEIRSFEAEVSKKLEEQNKISKNGDVSFGWPTPSHYINSYFHDTDYPFKKVFQHSGIDIRAAQGTPIRATGSGYVGRARTCTVSSCYAYVLIIHTGSISTLYGHLSTILVSNDAYVNKGDIIGYSGGKPGTVGAGPFVTGAHLHFEVRLNGIPVNPLPYLP